MPQNMSAMEKRCRWLGGLMWQQALMQLDAASFGVAYFSLQVSKPPLHWNEHWCDKIKKIVLAKATPKAWREKARAKSKTNKIKAETLADIKARQQGLEYGAGIAFKDDSNQEEADVTEKPTEKPEKPEKPTLNDQSSNIVQKNRREIGRTDCPDSQ